MFFQTFTIILIVFTPLIFLFFMTRKNSENTYRYKFTTMVYGENKMNSLKIMEDIEKTVMDLQFDEYHKSKILERIRLEIDYAKYTVVKELGQKAYEELQNKE